MHDFLNAIECFTGHGGRVARRAHGGETRKDQREGKEKETNGTGGEGERDRGTMQVPG